MKLRILALFTFLLAALLVACDNGVGQPTPTATISPSDAAQTITVMQQTPSAGSTQAQANQPTTTEQSVVATSQTAPPPTDTGGLGPLQLEPTTIETTDATRKGVLADERSINLPVGFHIKAFASGLDGVRWLGLSPEGLVYATITGAGKVLTLPDANKDGVADSVKTFADNLPGAHGIDFKDGAVYVATETEIVRLQDTNGDGVADKRDVLANDIPGGAGHTTRTLLFRPDGKMLISIGSSCNVCDETNEKRAAISLYSADGKFEKVYASGLRNAVGLGFQPGTGDLYATVNGRDGLGDDIPPETIYNIKEGTNYGWPFCYGDQIPDKTQNTPAGFCEKTGTPVVKMQAHSAPLGLAFYTGSQFPAQYKGDMFVAFHGSWNRSVPTGYKLVLVRFKNNQPDTSAANMGVEDFATGWQAGGDVWGRPVDPLVAADGSLLLTDDKAGVIYTIYYKENARP